MGKGGGKQLKGKDQEDRRMEAWNLTNSQG